MIENFDEYLTGIALGVRFNPNFSVRDNLGSIADEILYQKDSLFNPTVFPKVLTTEDHQQILINEDTNDQFRFNNLDFILEVNFKDEHNFSVTDLNNIIQKFESHIISDVMQKFQINNIRRIGFIRKYLFSDDVIAEKFIAKTIGRLIEGVTDCDMRFVKKIPLYESIAQQELNDYDNVIFTVNKKPDTKDLVLHFDYQSVFDPPLPKSTSIKFKPFIQKATNYYETHLIPMINQNILGE